MDSRKALALALIVSLGALVAPAQAGATEPATVGSGHAKAGTVVSLNDAARTATIKLTDKDGNPLMGDAAGELTIYWDDATKVEGTLSQGELVHFRTIEKDGRTLATWIHVGRMATAKPRAR